MVFLVIDDSAVTRKIVINDIKTHRNTDKDTFLEAEDGMDALDKATDDNVDIFLCDWNMPKMNGLEFVINIRKKDQYKETPIIMITSEGERGYVEQAIRSGVTDYILKPINRNKIWSKIEKYVVLSSSR